MYTLTLPAKYYCPDCRELLVEIKTDYKRRDDGYYQIVDVCPQCKSERVQETGFLKEQR